MDMNLKAFMKAELKERGTVEFPGVATFTDEKRESGAFHH